MSRVTVRFESEELVPINAYAQHHYRGNTAAAVRDLCAKGLAAEINGDTLQGQGETLERMFAFVVEQLVITRAFAELNNKQLLVEARAKTKEFLTQLHGQKLAEPTKADQE